jgi:hypothetical protein
MRNDGKKTNRERLKLLTVRNVQTPLLPGFVV